MPFLPPGPLKITFSVGIQAPAVDSYVIKDQFGEMPTATIASGILTFNVPQSHSYIGIGDKVILDGPVTVYLNEKLNTRRWKVKNANGSIPSNQAAPLDVTTIDKTFANVFDAISGGSPGIQTLLGTWDLITEHFDLQIACYENSDTPSGEIIFSASWLVDDAHRITIFTPNNISQECNANQRASATGYILTRNGNLFTGSKYVTLDGLILLKDGVVGGYGVQAGGSADGLQVLNCGIIGFDEGVEFTTRPDKIALINLVIRDCTKGIDLASGGDDCVCYNNLIVGGTIGLEYADTAVEIANITVQDSATCIDDNGQGVAFIENCLTSDATCTGGVSCHPGTTLKFKNKAGYDYRLHIVDDVAYTSGAGKDLSGDILFPFDKDAIGDNIDDTWCIGPFHYVRSAAFAVGLKSDGGGDIDLKSGAPTFTITDSEITFSIDQINEVLCAGCIVTDTLANKYSLKEKIADDEWVVSGLDGSAVANIAGTVQDIKFAYRDLKEAIYDSSGIETELGLTSRNMVNEDVKAIIYCSSYVSYKILRIYDYVCDEHRNIVIKSPNKTYEANRNRRHFGKWNELSYIEDPTDNTTDWLPHITYGDEYQHAIHCDGVDWLVIDGLQISAVNHGVYITGGKRLTITDNIIKNCGGSGIRIDKGFPSAARSQQDVIAGNVINGCAEHGIDITHGIGFGSWAESVFLTPASNSFKITEIQGLGITHVIDNYTVIYAYNPSLTQIEWKPGRLIMQAPSGTTMATLLSTATIIGEAWATITAVDVGALVPIVETRMDMATSFTIFGSAGTNEHYYIYNNTITECKRGIYIETLKYFTFTNWAVIRNNIVQGCELESYYTSHAYSNHILAEGNWSDDVSLNRLNGSANISSTTVRFREPTGNDFRLTLYDFYRMRGLDMQSDEHYQIFNDNTGKQFSQLNHAPIGANGWRPIKDPAIHCSVGDITGNLDSFPGGREIIIQNGILEFIGGDISGDIGIGDKVEYTDGGTKYCYLAEKGENKKWYAVDDEGDSAADTSVSSSVASIKRVFNSLGSSIDSLTAPEGLKTEFATILGGKDPATNETNVFVWCYNDNDVVDIGDIKISGWVTNAFYRINIETPWDVQTQCMTKQRHNGIWGGYRIQGTVGAGSGSIIVENSHITIKGIGATHSHASSSCLLIPSTGSPVGVIFSDNIMKEGLYGILDNSSNTNLHNKNISYDQLSDGIFADNGIIRNHTTINATVYGINSASGEVHNCISQDSGTSDFNGAGKKVSCIASDATGASGTSENCLDNISLVFVDKASFDFRLSRIDWQALNRGTSSKFQNRMIVDANVIIEYPFYRDIDRELLDGKWSIGADTIGDIETIDLYFSASTDTSDIKTSTPSIEIISGVGTFDIAQIDESLGIGDEIDYDTDNKKCYLYRKISLTQWDVKTKWGLTPNDINFVTVNSIKKAFAQEIKTTFDPTQSTSIQQFFGSAATPFYALRTARYKLNIPIYKNTTEHTATLTLRYFDVDEDHYIRLYTPADIKAECNRNQSHLGIRGVAGARAMIKSTTVDHALKMYTPYTVIDGLIFRGSTPNNSDCMLMYKAQYCKILNNLLFDGNNGIRSITQGHADPFVDNFLGSIHNVYWDSEFYTNWAVKVGPTPDNYVAFKSGGGASNDKLTPSGSPKSGAFDFKFGITIGPNEVNDDSLSLHVVGGGGSIASCEWSNGEITFASASKAFPRAAGRTYHLRMVRGADIASDGIFSVNGGKNDTIELYYLDDFTDGIVTGTNKWIAFPASVTGESGTYWLEVQAAGTHGFEYIHAYASSDIAGASTIGLNKENIVINNVLYKFALDGIRTSETDFLYNNTVDECSNMCIHNQAGDIVINNIAQRGGIKDYNIPGDAEYCMASDTSLNASDNNILSTTLAFIDKTSAVEFRNYHPVWADEAVLWNAKRMDWNTEHPYNIDGGQRERKRKWDRGALEYESVKTVYAVGHDVSDVKTDPSVGNLLYTIEDYFDRSVITFSTPQINPKFGIGNKIIDLGTPFSNGCVLVEKINSTQWSVIDFDGAGVGAQSGTISFIGRIFPDLETAFGPIGFQGIGFINSTDLIASNVYVELVCYDDSSSPPINGVEVSGFTCDKHHNIKITTPYDVDKHCNTSQRHIGIYSGSGFAHDITATTTPVPAAIYISSISYFDIEGLKIRANIDAHGIYADDCRNIFIGYNIIANCGRDGVNVNYSSETSDVIINNLIQDCDGDGIRLVPSPFSFVMRTYVRNNTVIFCQRAFHLDKQNVGYFDLQVYVQSNIFQNSQYADIVSQYENNFGRLAVDKTITSDATASYFPGIGNINNQFVYFLNRAGRVFELRRNDDGAAIDNGLDFSDDPLHPFVDDISNDERDPREFDIGAFEVIEIFGIGDLIIGTVIISGLAAESDISPTLILHLREPGPTGNETINFLPYVPDQYQFIQIEDGAGTPEERAQYYLNYWLQDKPPIEHLIVYMQGGISFEGTFEFLNRFPRRITVATYPEEIKNTAAHVYNGPIIDDVSKGDVLTYKNVKIYSSDSGAQTYLLDNTSVMPKLRFENCIIQVNYDSIIDAALTNVEVINSIVIYRFGEGIAFE